MQFTSSILFDYIIFTVKLTEIDWMNRYIDRPNATIKVWITHQLDVPSEQNIIKLAVESLEDDYDSDILYYKGEIIQVEYKENEK